MRQLEIIHVRSSGEPAETLSEEVRKSLKAAETGARVITVYRRRGLETDVAIHICHADEVGAEMGSSLGLRLASALKPYGLVEHTLWEELT